MAQRLFGPNGFIHADEDEDGTLTHETVDSYQAAIIESLGRAVGAQLRTL